MESLNESQLDIPNEPCSKINCEDNGCYLSKEKPEEPEEDSYDEELDEYGETRDEFRKVGSTEICLYTELRYARVLYKKARMGFDDDPPPGPLDWLENGYRLTSGWENFKVEQIGLIEHDDTPEKEKEDLKKFLLCATAVYMDLMASIYNVFFKVEIPPLPENREIEWVQGPGKDGISQKR